MTVAENALQSKINLYGHKLPGNLIGEATFNVYKEQKACTISIVSERLFLQRKIVSICKKKFSPFYAMFESTKKEKRRKKNVMDQLVLVMAAVRQRCKVRCIWCHSFVLFLPATNLEWSRNRVKVSFHTKQLTVTIASGLSTSIDQ